MTAKQHYFNMKKDADSSLFKFACRNCFKSVLMYTKDATVFCSCGMKMTLETTKNKINKKECDDATEI